MRLRTALIAGEVMMATLVVGAFALAQPRSGRPVRVSPRPNLPEKHAPPPPSSAAAGGSEDRAAPAPSVSATSAGFPASDAGSRDPLPGSPVAGGNGESGTIRLSALNPAPNEFADAAPSPSSVDYEQLLSEVASLRARVAAVSDTLFHSRIAVTVETSADHARIARLWVSLDDGMVWTSPAGLATRDAAVVYDHAVAPGHHAVTVEVEYREGGDTFRSSQRSRFVVDVPNDERLTVEIKVWDESSMNDFPHDKKGEYDLRIRARANAQPVGR